MIRIHLASFILQTQSTNNDMMRMLFVIAMLLTVLWWGAQKLFGRERANEIVFGFIWRLLKMLVLLPFKILGFILKLFLGNKNK